MSEIKWDRTWRIIVATPPEKQPFLLDATKPGELVLAPEKDVLLPGFTKAYQCTSVTNMQPHWQGCYFIKYGSHSLGAPAGTKTPYTAYGTDPDKAMTEFDKVATAAKNLIHSTTQRLLAAAVTQDANPRIVFLALYQIPNAVTPDPDSPTNDDKPFLLCKYWDPSVPGGGNPDGGGSGYGSRP